MKKGVLLVAMGLFLITCICITYAHGLISPNLYSKTGRDSCAYVGDGKFEIGKFGDNTALIMNYDDKLLSTTLLSYVEIYKKEDNKLYVISREGYAVVDGNDNTSKLCVIVDKQHYDAPTTEGHPEDEHRIIVLNSYDEFDSSEKESFEKLLRSLHNK